LIGFNDTILILVVRVLSHFVMTYVGLISVIKPGVSLLWCEPHPTLDPQVDLTNLSWLRYAFWLILWILNLILDKLIPQDFAQGLFAYFSKCNCQTIHGLRLAIWDLKPTLELIKIKFQEQLWID